MENMHSGGQRMPAHLLDTKASMGLLALPWKQESKAKNSL